LCFSQGFQQVFHNSAQPCPAGRRRHARLLPPDPTDPPAHMGGGILRWCRCRPVPRLMTTRLRKPLHFSAVNHGSPGYIMKISDLRNFRVFLTVLLRKCPHFLTLRSYKLLPAFPGHWTPAERLNDARITVWEGNIHGVEGPPVDSRMKNRSRAHAHPRMGRPCRRYMSYPQVFPKTEPSQPAITDALPLPFSGNMPGEGSRNSGAKQVCRSVGQSRPEDR
jgi:hypothetical protein